MLPAAGKRRSNDERDGFYCRSARTHVKTLGIFEPALLEVPFNSQGPEKCFSVSHRMEKIVIGTLKMLNAEGSASHRVFFI